MTPNLDTNYNMKDSDTANGEWRDVVIGFNVQPLLLPSTVYMQQCPSGCAGQSKILTVLLLAGVEWI